MFLKIELLRGLRCPFELFDNVQCRMEDKLVEMGHFLFLLGGGDERAIGLGSGLRLEGSQGWAFGEWVVG